MNEKCLDATKENLGEIVRDARIPQGKGRPWSRAWVFKEKKKKGVWVTTRRLSPEEKLR